MTFAGGAPASEQVFMHSTAADADMFDGKKYLKVKFAMQCTTYQIANGFKNEFLKFAISKLFEFHKVQSFLYCYKKISVFRNNSFNLHYIRFIQKITIHLMNIKALKNWRPAHQVSDFGVCY